LRAADHARARRYGDLDRPEEVTLYEVLEYESAGLWVDSSGHVCMPIRALFSDGETQTRLLYSSTLRKRDEDVDTETQWVLRPDRKNPGLSKRGRK
jgi:hypothetical protein